MSTKTMLYHGRPTEIITDDNWRDYVDFTDEHGEKKSRGLDPRSLEKHPKGSFRAAKPFDLPLIPKDQWQQKLDELIAAKARCSDLRMRGDKGNMIPSRDQNGKGYCWAHSSTSAVIVVRAREKLEYEDLSAYAVACMIKNFHDQGGFGAESLEFIAERGIPTAKYWPQKSMDRKNNNDETWANAALHKVTEWMDLKVRNVEQLVTCLLNSIPVVVDYNWWGHSVCALDLVSIDPLRILIWNSWGDGWSNHGMGILEAKKAIPDDAIAPRVMLATAA